MALSHRIWRIGPTIAVVLCLVLAACSDGNGETTTSAASNVEFGSGEVPDTVPEDFPIPPGSVVSSTLVNRDSGFTEMILRMGVEFGAAVQYYTQNLPTEFDITESKQESDTEWYMTATGADVDIEVRFRAAQPQVTEGVFTFQQQ